MIKTPHAGHVICLGPFPDQIVRKQKVDGGMVQIETHWTLVGLGVAFDNDNIDAGSTVYVRSSDAAEAWAKLRYRIPGNEQNYLIVPVERIVMVDDHLSVGQVP